MAGKYAVTAGLLVAALLGGLGYFILSDQGDARFAQCRETAIAGALGGPFEMIDHTGRTVTDAELIDRPTLLYFGYTFCPDVCPWDAARNALAVDMLAERGMVARPVFVTVDPGRDTPEVLARFTANLHEDMVGLTGTPEQVRATSQAYRTFFQHHEEEGEFYLVDHSTFSYLALPGHGVVEVYRRGQTAEEIADSMVCFIEAS